MDSVPSCSLLRALKNLLGSYSRDQQEAFAFCSFRRSVFVVENGGGDFFLPPLLLFVVFLLLGDWPGVVWQVHCFCLTTNGFKFLTKLNGESDERLFFDSEFSSFPIGVNGEGATRGSGSIVAGNLRRRGRNRI